MKKTPAQEAQASADEFRGWYRAIADGLRAKTGVGIDDFPPYSFLKARERNLLPFQVIEEIMASRYIVVPEKRRRKRKGVEGNAK